jgi:hypothetical protein
MCIYIHIYLFMCVDMIYIRVCINIYVCVGVGLFCSFRHDILCANIAEHCVGIFVPLANLVPEGVFSLQKPRLKMLTPTPNAWRAPPSHVCRFTKKNRSTIAKTDIYTYNLGSALASLSVGAGSYFLNK